jgi:hypothetical protein
MVGTMIGSFVCKGEGKESHVKLIRHTKGDSTHRGLLCTEGVTVNATTLREASSNKVTPIVRRDDGICSRSIW